MSLFSERLIEMRKCKSLTQKQVAEYLEISERAYQHYEYGTREPNIETLNKLAGYFNTSVDYLVGFVPSSTV